ncbi:MAG: 50S ribosomal protein L21 [Bryobacterales bacterium]|nr:50S ribosomal protein L21 [Bryobacterales bacterium]
MQAIIETGGKQYRVAPGDVVRVETLPGEPGSAIEIPRVVAVIGDEGQVLAGPEVADARVKATVTGEGRAKKVLVFKFKRKKQYKRTIGHRQNYTELRVDEIVV